MDRALWITWYDLPDAGRDAYLSWLQGSYIPKLLEKPGILWAAHYASDVTASFYTRQTTIPRGTPDRRT